MLHTPREMREAQMICGVRDVAVRVAVESLEGHLSSFDSQIRPSSYISIPGDICLSLAIDVPPEHLFLLNWVFCLRIVF